MAIARLAASPPTAVLLETPYGFQENAADISARARAYFAGSVGLAVTVAAGLGESGRVHRGQVPHRSASVTASVDGVQR